MEPRFSISDVPDFAVSGDLVLYKPQITVDGSTAVIQTDDPLSRVEVQMVPFRASVIYNDVVQMVFNEGDTLYFEKSTGLNDDVC